MDTKTICLALLSQGDTTGYEIKKAFEEGPFSYFQDVSYGSIYPALTKALDEGYVSVTEQQQSGRPARKVYSITDTGRAALINTLAEATAPDRVTSDFLFKVLFSGLLHPDALDELVTGRLAELNAKIDSMEGDADDRSMHGREHFVCGFGLAIYRAMQDFIEEHYAELIEQARTHEIQLPREAAD